MHEDAVQCDVITIGDELCRGEVTDTNKAWLSEQLGHVGVHIRRQISCRDVREEILSMVQSSLQGTELIVLSGGLGPTSDDLTVDCLAELANSRAIPHSPAVKKLESAFKARGRDVSDAHLRQVRVLQGSHVLENDVGFAPGFAITLEQTTIVALPGVPRELKAIVNNHLIPWLISDFSLTKPNILSFKTFGSTESGIAKKLSAVEEKFSACRFHYRAHFPEIWLKVTSSEAIPPSLSDDMSQALGKYLYSTDEDETFAQHIGGILKSQGNTVAVAESCTGGKVGALLTDASGASAYFQGGVIAYDNQVKTAVLGVSEELLEAEGAVSEECALAMAQGVRQALGSDWGIATTGIAGPTGGSDAKPVGTVWIAVANDHSQTTRKLYFPGSRWQVREVASYSALDLLRHQMEKDTQ